MNSLPDSISLENDSSFDTYEIDSQISKNGEYIKEIKKKDKKDETIKNIFKFLPGLTEEELNQKDLKSEFPKYFSKISTKNFEYAGILTNELKRTNYGYSKMENDDEFLGEYKNEMREGFGIYKFLNNEDEPEIYIGDYKNNEKTGEGLYLKIFKTDIDESNGSLLINFNCGIGKFEEDIFINGKIFTVKDGIETLYQGKLNEIGLPSDEDSLVVEEGNKIFTGKVVHGELMEGRNICVDENWNKIRAYYFTKSDNEKILYDFDLNKNEEKDNEIIEKIKQSSIKTYKNQIQNIYNDVCNAFEKFKNFESAIKVDFDNDVKKKLKDNIEKMIKN